MLTFNGKPFNADDFGKALRQVVENETQEALKKKAGPRIKLRKTKSGYVATGPKEDVEQFKRSL